MIKNAFILFALAFVVLALFLPTFSHMQDIRQQDLEYQKQIAKLEKENEQLREERRLLIEDPIYLEKVAREKMGLIRKGEVVYKLTPVEVEE